MTVYVRADHIAAGKRNDGDRCPVALAMRAAGIPVVHVGTGVAAGGGRVLNLPARVQRWIMLFDLGGDVRPFAFRVKSVLGAVSTSVGEATAGHLQVPAGRTRTKA